MKTPDRIATIIFWTVAGSTGLLLALGFTVLDFTAGSLENVNWWAVGAAVGVIAVLYLGIRECVLSIRTKKQDRKT
jgi:membrane protein YdbS with pleckstrin-like domain